MREQEPTPPLAEFRRRYEADDNEWWRLGSGDHQNLFDEALEEIDRLRNRTHEIQAEEMTKRAELDSEITEWRRRYDAAREWTETAGLTAEWASGEHKYSPFWSMTSYNARSALMRLVAERDGALARPDAATLREQIARTVLLDIERQEREYGIPMPTYPTQVADAVMAVLAEHGLVDREDQR